MRMVISSCEPVLDALDESAGDAARDIDSLGATG
jgi:hypothetical protein